MIEIGATFLNIWNVLQELSTFRNDNGVSHGGQRSAPIGSPKGATDSFPAWAKTVLFYGWLDIASHRSCGIIMCR